MSTSLIVAESTALLWANRTMTNKMVSEQGLKVEEVFYVHVTIYCNKCLYNKTN